MMFDFMCVSAVCVCGVGESGGWWGGKGVGAKLLRFALCLETMPKAP